jgi:hypothetical protein
MERIEKIVVEGMMKSKLLHGRDIWWTRQNDIEKLGSVTNQ